MQYSRKKREEARRLFLTGEATSIAEIARRLKLKPHTVGVWRQEEDWEGLRLKMEKKAAEQLVEKLASERVTLNASHFKLWGVVVSQLLTNIQRDRSMSTADLKEVSGILERAQKGQRLARGLSQDGQTEEQIRAEATAATRQVVDVFLDAVKTEVTDPEMRDRIARAVLTAVPHHDDDEGD